MAGNGLGPWWFPPIIRNTLTNISKLFFSEADWERHDDGYDAAVVSRATCDRKFFQAMIRDASKTSTMWKTWLCIWLASFYWIMVRLFGWMSYQGSTMRRIKKILRIG